MFCYEGFFIVLIKCIVDMSGLHSTILDTDSDVGCIILIPCTVLRQNGRSSI